MNQNALPSPRTHRPRSILAIGALVALGGFANHVTAGDIRVFDQKVSGVASANPEVISDNILSPEFAAGLVVQGLDALENPSGLITRFGYLSDNTHTEPDENTYLILDHNPGGPTPGYDYGRHFIFQGHENAGNRAYITRVNLDVANPDHHITLMTPSDANGNTGFNSIDGSSWNPFTQSLLFTQEAGNNGGVIEMGADFDPATGAGAGLRTLFGSIGRGGFEGIHTDNWGNVLIVEDSGGTTVNFGKNPNSFVYRFIPTNVSDLTQGKLQALQVSINGSPLTFVPVSPANPTGDMLSNNQLLLHTVGSSYPVRWVTIHDTAIQGTASFDANAAAKAAGATPFKRPENGQFQPNTNFESFVFVTTGDTDNRAGSQPALAARGAWGGIFRVDLDHSRSSGKISFVVMGDADHTAFDNITFSDDNETVLIAEDRGDTLHDQLNKLDSVWAYHLDTQDPRKSIATRFLALGEDRTAPIATAEDNEPTGLHISDGDSSVTGLIGTKTLKKESALLFFTQQHGENNLFEVFPRN